VKILADSIDRGRPWFTLSFYEGTKRRLRQFADEAEARTEAQNRAEQLNPGQGNALRSREGIATLTFRDEQLEPMGLSLSTAIQEFVDSKAIGAPLVEAAKFFHRAHLQKLPTPTIPQLVDELL
jgi:hypothetical protein